MKYFGFLLSIFIFSFSAARALGGESPYDRVLLYQMKEDPTMVNLIGDPTMKGFYGLELDELRGNAAVLYRSGESLHRVDMDLKVKGDQLLLRNGKRRKTLGREKRVLASGRTEEVIYPIECTPDKGGWRFGPSFRRNSVRLDDDFGKRLIVGDAYLEYQTAMARCRSNSKDCGPAGCGEWGAAAESSATVSGLGIAVSTVVAVVVPMSQAMTEGKLSEREMLTTYSENIEAMLPLTFGDLTAFATSYRTTTLPYPEMADPLIDQRGLKVGILSKTYRATDRSEVTIQVSPLLEEFRTGANKCGSWDSGSTRTLFDVKGRPAMYTQMPASTTAPESSSLIVCGEKISVAMRVSAARNRIYFTGLYDTLPVDAMERLLGK